MQYTKNWLDIQTSLFNCPADNFGQQRTFRQILFTDFGVRHHWFYKTDQWTSGESNDLDTIIKIREKEVDKTISKQTLQCYTPSANYQCKKKGSEILLNRLPLLQLDFDNPEDYDLDELRACVFKLPFVAFTGLSVSGTGLYAFIFIQEPERVKEYAEHLFEVFKQYSITVDTTKGRNTTDLRFVSYDANMCVRENPEPLQIKRFFKPPVRSMQFKSSLRKDDSWLIAWAVSQIESAQVGQRFKTVRSKSYLLGGYGLGLDEIKNTILQAGQYQGVESKYLQHADECFAAGKLKPIAV